MKTQEAKWFERPNFISAFHSKIGQLLSKRENMSEK